MNAVEIVLRPFYEVHRDVEIVVPTGYRTVERKVTRNNCLRLWLRVAWHIPWAALCRATWFVPALAIAFGGMYAAFIVFAPLVTVTTLLLTTNRCLEPWVGIDPWRGP